jgi:hypothetical protein
MSLEQKDSLRRKVREARERQAFKDSIASILSAKEAQAALLARRETRQDQLRQDRAIREQQRHEPANVEQQKGRPRIIRHMREVRAPNCTPITVPISAPD